jgi:hypothetical protein
MKRTPQMSEHEIARLEAVRRMLHARGFRPPPEPTHAAEQAALPLTPDKERPREPGR